jgi:hypothetical protein
MPVKKIDKGMDVSAISAGRIDPKNANKIIPTQNDAKINLN